MPTLADPNRQRAKSRARQRAARIVYAALDHTIREFDRAKASLIRAGFKDADAVVDTILRHDPN